MNLFNFTANLGSEKSCIVHFKEERDKIRVQCKCGSKEDFWIRSRMSLRSGMIIRSSNLLFLNWHVTMFLLTATKNGFSSKEIQKQFGLKLYEPAWPMVHKLRKAMGDRDARYTLE